MIDAYLFSILIWTTIVYGTFLFFQMLREEMLAKCNRPEDEAKAVIAKSQNCWIMLRVSFLVALIPVFRLLVTFAVITFRTDEDD